MVSSHHMGQEASRLQVLPGRGPVGVPDLLAASDMLFSRTNIDAPND